MSEPVNKPDNLKEKPYDYIPLEDYFKNTKFSKSDNLKSICSILTAKQMLHTSIERSKSMTDIDFIAALDKALIVHENTTPKLVPRNTLKQDSSLWAMGSRVALNRVALLIGTPKLRSAEGVPIISFLLSGSRSGTQYFAQLFRRVPLLDLSKKSVKI